MVPLPPSCLLSCAAETLVYEIISGPRGQLEAMSAYAKLSTYYVLIAEEASKKKEADLPSESGVWGGGALGVGVG